MPDFLNMLSWWQWTILAAIPPAIVLLYFLKLKRRPIAAKFAAEIEELYADEPGPEVHQPKRASTAQPA